MPTHVQAARAIAKCGAAGGTTREVMKHLRWDQGPASVALSRAAKRGLVAPTGERAHVTGASPGFTVYVATATGSAAGARRLDLGVAAG